MRWPLKQETKWDWAEYRNADFNKKRKLCPLQRQQGKHCNYRGMQDRRRSRTLD